MISRAGWWTWTPSATPLQPKKWKACFCITFNFWWSARLVDGPEPNSPPISCKKVKCSFLDYVQLLMIGRPGQWTRTPSASSLQPRKWNAHFWITFNFWWSARLVKGLEPYLQPVSNQKNKVSFFIYIQLLMISRAGRWTQTPSVTPLKPKKWNAHFCITFNFWWLAGLVIGLKLHPPALSSQKNEMLIFGLHLPSDDQPGWLMDSNPICHLSPGIK